MTDGARGVAMSTPMRRCTGGASELSVSGAFRAEALADRDRKVSALGSRIVEEDSRTQRFVNVFGDGSNAWDLRGEEITVKASDELTFVPAMTGGTAR